jgi:hypothetical protein
MCVCVCVCVCARARACACVCVCDNRVGHGAVGRSCVPRVNRSQLRRCPARELLDFVKALWPLRSLLNHRL